MAITASEAKACGKHVFACACQCKCCAPGRRAAYPLGPIPPAPCSTGDVVQSGSFGNVNVTSTGTGSIYIAGLRARSARARAELASQACCTARCVHLTAGTCMGHKSPRHWAGLSPGPPRPHCRRQRHHAARHARRERRVRGARQPQRNHHRAGPGPEPGAGKHWASLSAAGHHCLVMSSLATTGPAACLEPTHSQRALSLWHAAPAAPALSAPSGLLKCFSALASSVTASGRESQACMLPV